MMYINGIILCEGDSDQVLLGSYLSKIMDLEFYRLTDKNPFPEEKIFWYHNKNDKIIGIWNVGGCNFLPSIKKIILREKLEHSIESIIVVTDNDDVKMSEERYVGIYNTINELVSISNYDSLSSQREYNTWHTIKFAGSFSQITSIRYCFLLVPLNSQGALETFMLDALSEKSETEKDAIQQVKEFVKDFQSEKYLRKRREKIKAELGISLSIFCPEKMFDTMIEMINQVDWSTFDQTDKQFGILKEIF